MIDPIDGSLNARRTLPSFALSVAVATGPSMADVAIAFVHDFGADDEFTADPQRRRLARRQGSAGATVPATGSRSSGLEASKPELIAPIVSGLVGKAYRCRSVGALAISICYVAAARFDGMIAARPARSVDVAAAQLIAREAGASVQFGDGGLSAAKLDLEARFEIAAALDDEMLGTLRDVQRSGAPSSSRDRLAPRGAHRLGTAWPCRAAAVRIPAYTADAIERRRGRRAGGGGRLRRPRRSGRPPAGRADRTRRVVAQRDSRRCAPPPLRSSGASRPQFDAPGPLGSGAAASGGRRASRSRSALPPGTRADVCSASSTSRCSDPSGRRGCCSSARTSSARRVGARSGRRRRSCAGSPLHEATHVVQFEQRSVARGPRPQPRGGTDRGSRRRSRRRLARTPRPRAAALSARGRSRPASRRARAAARRRRPARPARPPTGDDVGDRGTRRARHGRRRR